MNKIEGFDAEEEFSNILQQEINKDILQRIARLGFEEYAAGVKAENREGKINSILEDKDFIEINIEETQMFKWLSNEVKWLSNEDKEKWKKYGSLK